MNSLQGIWDESNKEIRRWGPPPRASLIVLLESHQGLRAFVLLLADQIVSPGRRESDKLFMV